MDTQSLNIAAVQPDELPAVGALMARVYSQLEGFPSMEDQPAYYDQFYKLDVLTSSEGTEVFVAKSDKGGLLGGVVYFADMQNYGAGGDAVTSISNASGIRLLAVANDARGQGVGRTLTDYCIDKARQAKHSKVILHTTQFMPAAWKLYEHMGFVRYSAIDFKQAELDVYGFTLSL
jgi:GNAT superfamily N-acetyltransferase